MKTIVLWILVPTTLAAGIVSLPTVFINIFDGWRGVAVGFGAAWGAGVLVATVAHVTTKGAIKKAIGSLIFSG